MSITATMYGREDRKEEANEGTKKTKKTLFDHFKEICIKMNEASKNREPVIKKKGSELWERFKNASVEAYEEEKRNPKRSLLVKRV